MGTVAEKLAYLQGTKEAIASAITDKGQTVASTDTFRSYADKIKDITTEGELGSVDITENGIYHASDSGYDGFNTINVNVASGGTGGDGAGGGYDGTLVELDVTENGEYDPADYEADGFSYVSVNVADSTIPPDPNAKFKVEFVNGEYGPGTILQTVSDVPYGGYATFTGATPVKEGYYFVGWNPTPSNITSNTVCYAQFSTATISADEIQDPWEVIVQNKGANYGIGAWKLLNIGVIDNVDYGTIRMQKVAAGESGTTSTWIAMDSFKNGHRMNASSTSNGGWAASEMRSWLNTTVFSNLLTVLKNAIVESVRYSRSYDASNNVYYPNIQTQDKLWIPSRQEIFGYVNDYESSGQYYGNIYTDAASRIKKYGIDGSSSNWWLRSVYDSGVFRSVNYDGYENGYSAGSTNGVCLGFCL